MIASELLMLNISNAGDTVARPTLKFFETFRSSCAMRSTNDALYGTTATVSDVGAVGEPMNVAGRIADRRRPLRLVGVVGRREPANGSGLRVLEALHVVTAILVDFVEVRRELVARADLPRQAREHAADVLIVDPLPAG